MVRTGPGKAGKFIRFL